ncbi:MAG: YaeQ family protein [Pseudomonadota bacterium]
MALKSTVHKFRVSLNDLNRGVYESPELTVALHPSETVERMVVRVLAWCLNAQPGLTFCKGLSDVDEPDLWVRALDESVTLWIEAGEPASDRVKRASRLAGAVHVYSFNAKAATWWQAEQRALERLNCSVFGFAWDAVVALAACVERTNDWSVTISEQSIFVSTAQGDTALDVVQLA